MSQAKISQAIIRKCGIRVYVKCTFHKEANIISNQYQSFIMTAEIKHGRFQLNILMT